MPIMITEPGLVSEAVLRGWLAAGLPISEVWTASTGRSIRHLREACRGVAFRTGVDLRTKIPRIPEDADCLFTVMTLQIVPPPLLERFPRRGINLHPAVLPGLRGKAPRQSMLADGTERAHGGVTAHILDAAIDTGDIISQTRIPPDPGEGWRAWEVRLALAAADTFVGDVRRYLDGDPSIAPRPQSGGIYRTSLKDEFVITSDKSIAEVRHLMERLRGALLVCRPTNGFGARPKTFVRFFGRQLGDASGADAVWTHRAVQLDLADGRVELIRPGLDDKLSEIAARWRVRREAQRIGRRVNQ